MTDMSFAPGVLDRSVLLQALRAYRKGDFSVRLPLDLVGIDGEIAVAFNDAVELNQMLAREIARIRDEVGKEGHIHQRMRLPAAVGAWSESVDSINTLIGGLVQPTAEIARVIESVAKGDLSQTLALAADGRPLCGEFLRIAGIVNTMVAQLGAFASEVSRVAREVGTEGKLGGQAKVPGAVGLWRDLTDNVNQLAANLTTQVRAIAEVATAVTKSDLTRSIMVEAQGEVAALKDNINEMIRNLKDTTRKNNEQDWLKTNVARFTRMLQGHRDLLAVSRLVLSELAPLVNAQQAVFYVRSRSGDRVQLKLVASYAHRPSRRLPRVLRFGERLIGQCALEKRCMLLTDVPGDCIRIASALGAGAPLSIIVLPVLFEGEVMGVIELASFDRFSDIHLSFLDQLTESIGIVFNNIEAGMRTEDLLKQSQSLTRELQRQQRELRMTNDRLEQQAENLQRSEALLKRQQKELRAANEQLQEKAKLLSEQMRQVEYKNREVEQAKAALEEKAEQLALSSRYKSEFLANMSHELRTPLNSLLILAKLLAENAGGSLSAKQVEYAETIYAAGTDLLSLISDILDLAKIESGTVTLNVAPERYAETVDYVERTFRQVANGKGLAVSVAIDARLPPFIHTDAKRLQQILKNLLANAFKFTHEGRVALEIAPVEPEALGRDAAERMVAFSVSDTGIGIPPEKQKVIFDAFRQADGTTSREYGGTGLGLSISRELARLLGGEIHLRSTLGKGSVFTLYLPVVHRSVAPQAGLFEAALLKAGRVETPGRPEAPPRDGPHAASAGACGGVEGERTALIVADRDEAGTELARMAAEHGFKSVRARDAHTGFMLAKQLRPDAIAVGALALQETAWLLGRLRRSPETARIPFDALASCSGRTFHLASVSVASGALKQALVDIGNFQVSAHVLVAANGDADHFATQVRDAGFQVTEAEAPETGPPANIDALFTRARIAELCKGERMNKVTNIERLAGVPIVVCDAPVGEAGIGISAILLVTSAESREPLLDDARRLLQYGARNPVERPPRPMSRSTSPFHRLNGRKVLVVDDDVRNIFALAGALQEQGLNVVTAENGRDVIEMLEQNADCDAVLMDIMMPELDGYDTTRVIRGMERYRRLPIIAVTARAMHGDREKCLEAGASDYIAKPVDIAQLLAMLDRWIGSQARLA